MLAFYWIAGIVVALVWISRVMDGYGGLYSIPDISRPEWDKTPEVAGKTPRLSIVVPARDEAAQVEAALTSLLLLDYPDYEVLAIDDRSGDGTAEIMDRVAAAHSGRPLLRIIHIHELPPGWLGKPHAMWTAAQQATGDWVLFTDADVTFRPDALRRALAYCEEVKADHLVLLPSYIMKTVGERMMMANFQMMFLFGHRPWKVSDPRAPDNLGLGPFNLVRRRVYEAIGTFQALRMEVIEDMKLGKLVKTHGYSQHAVFGPGLLPWRWANGGLGVVRNLTKNFFAFMLFRWGRALGACALWAFLNLMPFLGLWLAPGWAKLGYGMALAGIVAIYAGMSSRSPIKPLGFVLHPIGTVMLVYTMLRSMAHALRHGGVVWRGTRYSLDELRRGLV